jgi:hypothetical protein
MKNLFPRLEALLVASAQPSEKLRLDRLVVGDCAARYEDKILDFIPKLFTAVLS